MDILLIEDNDHRRVTLLRDLLGRGHRVTPCSSADEAHEILKFLSPREAPADAVVIARELMAQGGAELQLELNRRFIGIRWIMLPPGRGTAWVANELESPGLDILLIEADDERREAMIAHMTERGDRVTACRSLEDAHDTLAGTERAPHAIVADVHLSDGNGLSFYLAASRRFPEIRWIVTTAPQFLPVSA
jgi:ActR/RegA family two-component response regulator